MTPAHGVPLCTGAQTAWEHLGRSAKEGVLEVQEGHGGHTYKDLFGGLSTHLSEDRSIMSTCTRKQSSAHQEVDAEPLELPSASSSTKGSTEEAAKCSELPSPAQLAQQSSVSGNSQPWDTPVKGLEEKQEDEELPEAQVARKWDRDLQSVWLALFSKENEVEAEACALASGPWDEGHSKLFLTSEPEEISGFSASPFSGDPCEERPTRRPAKHSALHKQLCMGPDDLVQLRSKRREELEKLEEEKMYAELLGDMSSMSNEESPMMSSYNLRDPTSVTLEPAADPSVPLSSCCVTEETTGETQNYSELVSPELLADLGSDSEDSPCLETLLNELLEKVEQEEEVGERDREVESALSLPPRDEALKPVPTPPDSDLSDQGHSEPLPSALPEEAKGQQEVSNVPEPFQL
ncbi:unnamed protein product [Coccothraustes coccothraustes]